MTELIGDICEPSVLIVPPSAVETVSGSFMVSGGALSFISGGAVWEVSAIAL